MKLRLLALVLLPLAAAARADTENMLNSMRVLDFTVTKLAGPQEPGLPGLDIDGDGFVSRAEAAGHAEVTAGFDRADRNRDGRVSQAEWQRYEKWQEKRAKAKAAREARLAKARESASAGASSAKPKKK
jgi:hypothetical protein